VLDYGWDFDPKDTQTSPWQSLQKAVKHAEKLGLTDPNAMSLSTVNTDGAPSQRTVLLKNLDDRGLVFFTNYQSQKSQEMSKNNKVSALFFWPTIAQQIRINGEVEKISREETEAYFASRPRLSQIGAWASEQSQKIESLLWLEERVQSFEKKFEGEVIPCPPHWGGWRIKPKEFEFWFGRDGRLHERYCYNLTANKWTLSIKSP
jgi:pyridoxamine 5'-phosphate oxidase